MPPPGRLFSETPTTESEFDRGTDLRDALLTRWLLTRWLAARATETLLILSMVRNFLRLIAIDFVSNHNQLKDQQTYFNITACAGGNKSIIDGDHTRANIQQLREKEMAGGMCRFACVPLSSNTKLSVKGESISTLAGQICSLLVRAHLRVCEKDSL